MIVLEHWVFLEDYLEFYQMEIVNHRRKMLDAMESNSKGNDNFATKLIRMENVEGKSSSLKKYGRSKKKKSNLFFSKLLPWATSLKLENYYISKILACNVQSMSYLNNGSSSSRAIYKSILHVCMLFRYVWHSQGLLMHVTVYNIDVYDFWVISWTLNYALKTGWTWSSK